MAERTDRVSDEEIEMMGEYMHSLDQRNRLAIPAKLRETLGDSFVICVAKNGDRCLFGYTNAGWKAIMDKLNEQAPSYNLTRSQRIMHMNADTVELDSKGRITLPLRFMQQVGIENEVMILGVGRRVEFWSKEEWERMVDRCSNIETTEPIHLAF